jgi:copper chaperone CopZ
MKTITLESPFLFGDHHVVEVRRLLFEIDGVSDVYASSSFRVIEVTFDPAKVNQTTIESILEEAGYLGNWTIPEELGDQAVDKAKDLIFMRHTAVYESTRQTVSFSQKTISSGKPLWNCPGVGVITTSDLINKMEE